MITPEAVARIARKMRPEFTTSFSPEAHMRALDGLREAERHYYGRLRGGRVTWRSVSALKTVRKALDHRAIPAWLRKDIATRLDDVIAGAPPKPQWKVPAAKVAPTPAPDELLIGQDLPRAYLALTGERAFTEKHRHAPDNRKKYGLFVNAVLKELGLPARKQSTINRCIERHGIRRIK